MSDDTPDLFGHTRAQGDLFAGAAPRADRPRVDPERVRHALRAMLAELKSAREGSPWPGETSRRTRVSFPQLANWLPVDEAEPLRLEVQRELVRLDLAA